MGEIGGCGICGSPELNVILDLGEQPLAERDSKPYPLTLVQCLVCSLVQLNYIVDQVDVFPAGHPYATGNTRPLREHFAWLAAELEAGMADGDLVVDVGCNDGTLLAGFTDRVRRLGVEPTDQAAKCAAQGIQVWQNYFTAEVGHGIRHLSGPAKVVTACNVLAHVPDVHDFMAGVTDMLDDDGVFVTENHALSSITEGLQIDTVYHEHLRYYSVSSLSRLLAMHGLDVATVTRIPTHGGSLRVTARKVSGDLDARALLAAAKLNQLVMQAKASGPVYGVGAATRATPLIHFAGLTHAIDCVCEVASSEKIGMLMPGTSIPVVDEVRLIEDQPPHALLFSWHIAGALIPKLRQMGYKGKFIIPLPEPEISDR